MHMYFYLSVLVCVLSWICTFLANVQAHHIQIISLFFADFWSRLFIYFSYSLELRVNVCTTNYVSNDSGLTSETDVLHDST